MPQFLISKTLIFLFYIISLFRNELTKELRYRFDAEDLCRNHPKQLNLVSCKAVKRFKTFPRNFHELLRGPQLRRFWTKSDGRLYWSLCNSNPHGRVRVGFYYYKKNAPFSFFLPYFNFVQISPRLLEMILQKKITNNPV